jgi:DNA-directed RNA polymerase specialized sigma24 family protein
MDLKHIDLASLSVLTANMHGKGKTPDLSDHHDRTEPMRFGRAFRSLSRREQRVFRAIRIDDLSYAQIAAREDMTVAEVEAVFAESLLSLGLHMDRPRPRLRRLLDRLRRSVTR